MQKFQEGDIQGAVREADLFADEGIAKRVQQDIETVTSPSMDSWDAVAIVKKNAGMIRRCAKMWTLFNTAPKRDVSRFLADVYDNMLIYKAGNGDLYNGEDFIFKSSKVCCT